MYTLSDFEIQKIKNAFKSTSQGITNNQTFNNTSHSNADTLTNSTSSEVFIEDKSKKKVKKHDPRHNGNA